MKRNSVLKVASTGVWLLLAAAHTRAQVTVDWTEYPGGVSVAGDGLGNSYATWYDYNPAGDIYLTKRDAGGATLWEVRYDQLDNTKWERASWVACDPAGNALVCGTLMSGYSSPVTAASILMKFDPAGALLWRQVFDGPFDGSSAARCITDGDGNCYVTGLGVGPLGLVSRVKAFNPDGSTRWDWFDTAGIGKAFIVKHTRDNALVVAARGVVGSVNGYAKLDLQGNTLWALPGISSLTVGDVAGDSQGNSYVVYANMGGGGGTVIHKLDPAGGTLWSVVHPFSGFRVEIGGDDLPVVCGFPTSGQGGAAFVKYAADGTVLWQNLNADGPQALLLHAQLLLDSQDNAYLAAGTLFQQAVCKVNSDGSEGWTALVSGGSAASAIAMGPGGRVYMAGGNTSQLSQPWTAGLEAPVVSIVHDLHCLYHLEWPSVPGAILYRVRQAPALGAPWVDLGTTDQLQWDLGCLPAGTGIYQVVALDQ
jgi:hypothetical protein